MFDNVSRSKIQDLSQCIIISEGRFILGDLPKLSIQTLDDVGRIYYLADFGRICKKRRKNIPILLPASNAAGIRFCPFFFELSQWFYNKCWGHRQIELKKSQKESISDKNLIE